MEGDPTRYYKVECPREEDLRILGDMMLFARKENIGLVGNGTNVLSYGNDKEVYFSYFPSQPSHPSVKRKPTEKLVAEFEERLNQSGLRWKTFDLGKLLETI